MGFGLEFAEANIGDMGGMDWQDVNSGIDYLVEQGVADPERLGIGGGSYGGYMAAWAVTQSTRFKAAVPRAGIYDWRAFHGKSYLNGWEVVHYGGTEPWDVLDAWERFSPINHVRNVETPTLMVHGELDLTCPVEGAYSFYRALKELGWRPSWSSIREADTASPRRSTSRTRKGAAYSGSSTVYSRESGGAPFPNLHASSLALLVCVPHTLAEVQPGG